MRRGASPLIATAALVLGLAATAACQTAPALPDDALVGAAALADGGPARAVAAPDAGSPAAPVPAPADAGAAVATDAGAAVATDADGGTAAAETADAGTPAPDPNADTLAVDEGTTGAVSGMREHGGWVPAEILEIEGRVKGSRAEPTSLVYVAGSLAPYCQELYRFRFQYGAMERFAEVAAFRKRSDAKDCEQNYRNEWKSRAADWRQLEQLQHRVGHFYLRFSPDIAGETAIRTAMLKAVEASSPKKISRLPAKVQPAGSSLPAEDLSRSKPPPPMHRKQVGVRKIKPKAAGAPPSVPIKN